MSSTAAFHRQDRGPREGLCRPWRGGGAAGLCRPRSTCGNAGVRRRVARSWPRGGLPRPGAWSAVPTGRPGGSWPARRTPRIVSQVDIWQHEEHAVYRHYRNLLIRPADDGGGFAHHEAQHPQHPDWLWRLARHTRRGQPKAAWMTAGAVQAIPADGVFRVGQRREQVAANYVLFSASLELTFILSDPPLSPSPGHPDSWRPGPAIPSGLAATRNDCSVSSGGVSGQLKRRCRMAAVCPVAGREPGSGAAALPAGVT